MVHPKQFNRYKRTCQILIICIILGLFWIVPCNKLYAEEETAAGFWESHNMHLSPPLINYCVLIPRNEVLFNNMPYTLYSVSAFFKHIVIYNLSYEIGAQFYYWHRIPEDKYNILQAASPDATFGRTWQIAHLIITASYNVPIFPWLLFHAGFGGTVGFFADGGLFAAPFFTNKSSPDVHRFSDNGLLLRGGFSFAFSDDFMVDLEYLITFLHSHTDWHGVNLSVYLIW